MTATVLVRDFAGTHERRNLLAVRDNRVAPRVQCLASHSFTEYRGWSSSGLDTARWITVPLGLAGFVLLGIGTVMRTRQRREARQAGSAGK